MTNVVGYICVAVISFAISTYAIYMKRDKYKISTYIVFYIFSGSITWIGEFIVLGLFNSYAYKTGVIGDIWAQNLLGHLFLNAFMFPAASIVMVAYSFEYIYMIVTALIFVIVEYIFIKLGLYEQHWWRYYMSFINVIAFLLITKKWFSKMNQQPYGLTRALTLYFAGFLFIHLPSPILLLLGKQHFQLDWINNIVNNFYRSSIMVAFIYHLIITGVFTFFICNFKKWYWKLAPYIIAAVVLTILARLNVLITSDGWKPIYYVLIQQVVITIFILLEKYTLKPNEKLSSYC